MAIKSMSIEQQMKLQQEVMYRQMQYSSMSALQNQYSMGYGQEAQQASPSVVVKQQEAPNLILLLEDV